MKLSMRLAAGFGVLLLMMVLIIFFTFTNMNQLNTSLQYIKNDSDIIGDYYKMENSVLLLNRSLSTLLLYPDPDSVRDEIKKIQKQREIYNKIRVGIDKKATTKDAIQVRANIDQNAKRCNPLIDKIIELVQANKKEEATRLFLEKTKELLAKWEESLTTAVDMMHQENGRVTKDVNEGTNKTILLVLLLGGCSLIFGIFIAFFVINSVSRSINRVTNSIMEGVNQVASAAVQLSASSQQLSQGSSEQASNIDEVSSTMEETVSMLQQNTANTTQAAQLTEQAKESADKGDMEMQDMMNSMQEIQRSSNQIVKIIKVIDEIAFQTNILALNAAIEAARAGESGMGFAVVAEEVRNLAQKSAQAAQETSAILEANIDLSEQGVAAAERVRNALNEITAQTKKVNELMGEISAASQEQLQGIDQINMSVAQVAIVTQQNAATAEESAAAAEEMNAQAEGMRKMVHELMVLINGKAAANKKALEYSNQVANYLTPTALSSNGPANDNITIVSPEEVIPLEKDPHHF